MTLKKSAPGRAKWPIHRIHHLQAHSAKRGLVCIHDASLFSFPGRPFTSRHPSPSPAPPHALSSLRAIAEQNACLLVPAMDHLFAHYL